MNFKHTEALLKQKILHKDLDTYAILIHCRGKEKTFFSANANEWTYFDVASMGKVLVTSTLILHAVGQGRLTLDHTLQDFFPVDEDKKNITVRQLLTHTSGIIRYPITPEAVTRGNAGIVQDILSHPLAYQPGEDYIYSCNGFLLLGFILEKIYGLPLEEIYSRELKEPLGLKRTAFEIGFDEPNSAVCYRYHRNDPCGTKRFDDENVLAMGKVGGSGGEQSCLHDIWTFITAVLEKNELLYPKAFFAAAEKNYTPHYSEGRGLGYLVVDEHYKQTGKLFPMGSFGHCGFTGQSFFINREKDLAVILLTNTTRCTNIKNDFKGIDYQVTMQMREDIHQAILQDCLAEALL